jgi:protein-S-isoprenylcysteine O-methyltransferase Ste14
MLKRISVLAFALMVAGLVSMMVRHELLGRSLPTQAIQVGAVGLMLWARLVFGRRSFHAAADPTAGGLVTTGPYHYLRHPIYAAVLYFVWAGALDYHTITALGAAIAVTTGAALRIQAEEQLLRARFPNYLSYSARTARLVPFLL